MAAYDRDRIDGILRLIDAPKSDIFDVLVYVRFTLDPLSRSERVEGAKATGLGGYEAEMREFLRYILQAYPRALALSSTVSIRPLNRRAVSGTLRQIGSSTFRT